MKKIIWLLLIIILGVILFVPKFTRTRNTSTCICFVAGPCPACDLEQVSLWDIIKDSLIK